MTKKELKNPPKKLVSAAAQKVVDLLREEDKVIGHLTDFKAKWLVGFCNFLFNTNYSKMAVDFNSDPRRILLAPYNINKEGKPVPYPANTWDKTCQRLETERHAKGLPGHIGIEGYEVVFVRELKEDVNVE